MHSKHFYMRFVTQLLVATMLTMLLLLVISCNKKAEDAEAKDATPEQVSTEEQNNSINETNDALLTEDESLEETSCSFAYSADLVFLSDPIFALHFITDAKTNYSEFYAMALRQHKDARMFVSAEAQSAARLGLPLENLPQEVQLHFKALSKRSLATALRSRAVVLSPLMRLFAPRQMEYIEAYRKRCTMPPMRTLNAGGYNKNTERSITVRYTQAVQEMSAIIAHRMQEENINSMVAILDEPTVRNVEDISILISALKNTVDDFQIRLLWEKRNSNSEAKTFEELDSIADNEIVLLHAGMYTSRASQYLREQERVEQKRIFAITSWQHLPYNTQNTMSYGIYADTWVAAPLSALFENKNYVSAKLYRIL